MVNRVMARAVALLAGAWIVGPSFAAGVNPVGDLLGDSPGSGGASQASRNTYKNFGGQGIGDVGRKLGDATTGTYKVVDLSDPATRPGKIAEIRDKLNKNKKTLPPFTPTTKDGKVLTNDLSPSEYVAYLTLLNDGANSGTMTPPPAKIRIVDQATLSNMSKEDREKLESWRIEKTYKVTRIITPIYEQRVIFYPN